MDVSVILYKISNKVSKKLIRQTDTNRLTAAGMNGVKTSSTVLLEGELTLNWDWDIHTTNKQNNVIHTTLSLTICRQFEQFIYVHAQQFSLHFQTSNACIIIRLEGYNA